MKTSLRKSLARVATVMSLMAVGVAGAGAATASAATAELTITPTGLGFNQYDVSVVGTVRNVPTGSYVEIRLWDDDDFSDDFIVGPMRGEIIARRFFAHEFRVYGNQLDRDCCSPFDGEEEIYAGVRVYDPSGRQIDQVESNRVVHDYE